MNPLHEQLAKLSPEQRALFEQKLKERGLNVPGQNRIPARSQEGALPLSFAQERLWFVQQFDPQNTAYNVSSALRLRGTLDQEALHRALSGILTRHESLRTSFHKNEHGQPEIRVHESDRAALAFIELAGTSDEESEALEKISTLVAKPFDLTTPPLQFCLFHLAD
ncbi:MAG TPA: non-ribosomal peptide synthetase, partial [Verrucomicrobiales bacterium]|nr:non-ribosomal peptide synthetase [Verrucomicrobiales bacterium]